MKKGIVGVKQLNKSLQEILNPPDKYKLEKQMGEGVFRQGDKVMQIKNNYNIKWLIKETGEKEKGSLTGILIIQTIDVEEDRVVVLFDDEN